MINYKKITLKFGFLLKNPVQLLVVSDFLFTFAP